MSGSLQIASWRMDSIATWHQIPVVPDDSPWPEQVADALTEGEWAHCRVAENLRREHLGIIDEPESHMMAGIWVPEPQTGEICGLMFLDLIIPDAEGNPVTRDLYRALVEPDRRRGITVHERHLAELDLPAGPALLAREIIARPSGLLRWRRTVQENAIYTVFPVGSGDAVQFTCSTELLHRGEVMAADAAFAIGTLELELGETT